MDMALHQGQWDLSSCYVDASAWKEEYRTACQRLLGDIDAFRGKLNQGPSLVATLLDHYFAQNRRLEKLFVYAHLSYDTHLKVASSKEMLDTIMMTYHQFSAETSWIRTELIELDQETFASYQHAPELATYRQFFKELSLVREHTLAKEQEELLAKQQRVSGQFQSAFVSLNNADVRFAQVHDSQNIPFKVTQASYLDGMISYDRELRKNVFNSVHTFYQEHAHVMSELLLGRAYALEFDGKSRHFKNPVEMALKGNAIDPAIMDSLITTTESHLDVLHRYIALRAARLKMDQITSYDLMVPLEQFPKVNLSFEEGCQIICNALLPLGEDYVKTLRRGLLEEGWVDVYEKEGKRSGAYSSGSYDTKPYILMNWTGSLSSLFTLIHEAGHSMHSYLSHQHQPFHLSNYTIFVAEIASTVNELLLYRYLMTHQDHPYQKRELLGYMIDALRATFFRQTLFAHFEKTLHEKVWNGVPLTMQSLTELYGDLTQRYYGPSFKLEPLAVYECFRIPHFYTPFYVYQYATGISAAITFVEKIMSGKEGVEDYLRFLSAGASFFPTELLGRSGIVMTDSKTYLNTLNLFKEMVEAYDDQKGA